MYELAGMEESCEMLSSGQDTVVSHISSHQLWLFVQDLSKIKPVKIPT